MKKLNQKIKGNGNIQVGINNGDIIKTERLVKKTEVVHNKEEHITDAQALQLRNKLEESASMLSSDGSEKSIIYKREYAALYKAFGITSYKLLPKDKFDEAIKWFQKRIASLGRKVIRKSDNDEWRKQLYKAINAKSRQLKIEDLYSFAFKVLELKQPISSLKDLSDTRLKKLYTKLFNKRV